MAASLREKTTTGIAWTTVEDWGGRIANFMVMLVLARLLSEAAFGLVALAGVFVALAKVLIDQGFSDAIVQRETLTDGHLDTALWINVGTGVVLAGLTAGAAPWIAQVMGEAALTPLLRVLAVVFVLRSLSGVQQALFQRTMDFRVLALRSLAAVALGGAVGIGMAVTGFGVWSLIGQQVTYNAVEMVVLWTASDWRPGFTFSAERFRELFGFSAYMTGTRLLNFAANRSDTFLVGAFLGPVALGLYDLAFRQMHTASQLLTGATSRVTFSTFSRMQDDPAQVRRFHRSATQFGAALAFPLFGLLMLWAPEVMVVLFGDKWAPSGPLLRVLAAMGLLQGITLFNGAVIKGMGRSSWTLVQVALYWGVRLGLMALALAFSAGAMGIAVAYVAGGYLVAPLGWWMVHRLVGLPVGAYLRALAPVAAAALVGIGLSAVVRWSLPTLNLYVHLAAGVGSGLLAYAGALYLLQRPLVYRALRLARALTAPFRPSRSTS